MRRNTQRKSVSNRKNIATLTRKNCRPILRSMRRTIKRPLRLEKAHGNDERKKRHRTREQNKVASNVKHESKRPSNESHMKIQLSRVNVEEPIRIIAKRDMIRLLSIWGHTIAFGSVSPYPSLLWSRNVYFTHSSMEL
jgi:hypothetical protein